MRPTVLYVDDNTGDVLLLRQALAERFADIEVQVIDDGEQALRYLKVKSTARDAPPPDVILLGMRLPKVEGGALWKFIAEDEYLRCIPTFVFDTDMSCPPLCPPPARRLARPTTWDQYLELTDLLMEAIRINRDRLAGARGH